MMCKMWNFRWDMTFYLYKIILARYTKCTFDILYTIVQSSHNLFSIFFYCWTSLKSQTLFIPWNLHFKKYFFYYHFLSYIILYFCQAHIWSQRANQACFEIEKSSIVFCLDRKFQQETGKKRKKINTGRPGSSNFKGNTR